MDIYGGYLDVYLTLCVDDELSGCIFIGAIWMSTLLYVSTMSYLDEAIWMSTLLYVTTMSYLDAYS